MLKRPNKLLWALIGATMLSVTAGCGGDDDAPPPPATNTTQIRAVHASSNAPALDVYVNNASIASGVTFGSQTGFATVTPGVTRLQIAATGTPVSTALIDIAPNLASTVRYTAVAIGDATQTSGAARVQAVLIEDGGAAPAAGQAKVRIVHGAPAAGPVDVYFTPAGATLPVAATASNFAYASVAPASGTPALAVNAGSFRVRVTPPGQPGTILYDSGSINIAAGDDLVVVAVPDTGAAPSNSTLQMLFVASTGGPAFFRDNRVNLRLANFAPNLTAVDAFVKSSGAANDLGNRVATGLAYTNLSAYLPFASGTYDTAVALTGTLASSAELNGVTLAPRTSTSVFVTGLVNGPSGQQLQMKSFADDRVAVAGQAKVRVIHLVPDAPAVDLVVLTAGVISSRPVTNLAYPNATASSVVLAPGTYTLAIVPTGANTPLLPSAAGINVTLAAGDVKTVLAIGALAPGTTTPTAQPLALQVLDDK